MKSPEYDKVYVLARRTLDEWKEMEEFKDKMEVIERQDFSDLTDLDDKLKGTQKFFCCLGSRVKMGKEEFIKVDYHYPLEFARLG